MELKIEKILKIKNITKEELAEKTGISLEIIEKLVKGELNTIEVKDMEKICIALECQPEDLFINE